MLATICPTYNYYDDMHQRMHTGYHTADTERRDEEGKNRELQPPTNLKGQIGVRKGEATFLAGKLQKPSARCTATHWAGSQISSSNTFGIS